MIKLLLALALITLSQCSLFAPREATIPTVTSFTLPRDASHLLTLLQVSLKNNTRDQTLLLLSGAFSFSADSLDSGSLSAPFRHWDRQQEGQMLSAIANDSSRWLDSLNSTSENWLLSRGDSAALLWSYEAKDKTGNRFSGRAELSLHTEGGQWSLVKWNDRRNSALPGLGFWHLAGVTP